MVAIVISGPDGVGKSTIAREVCRVVDGSGVKAVMKWSRYNHFFAKVVNLLGRVLGKSYRETIHDVVVGYHDYSGVFGYLYIAAVFLDHIFAVLAFCFKALNWRRHYIYDRFLLDAVADLMVDTGRGRLILCLFAPLLKVASYFASFHIIQCKYEIVCERRPDVCFDKRYKARTDAYALISKAYTVRLHHTDKQSACEVAKEVYET